jgi:hypothetical protein
VFVVAVNDPQSRYSYPARVRFELAEGDLSSCKAAADFLNSSNIDLVCLQHEYGIYGGKAGSHVLRLLQHLKVPMVATLHTVLRESDIDQLIVLQEIAARSDRLIVPLFHRGWRARASRRRTLPGCIRSASRFPVPRFLNCCASSRHFRRYV